METQEVTLHNELKHKSIFLRDFTTAAQMLWQVLRRCFGSCGNEREYHCTRQKVRLRHCCPPCSLCCRVVIGNFEFPNFRKVNSPI